MRIWLFAGNVWCLKNRATNVLLSLFFICLALKTMGQGVYNKMSGEAVHQYMLIPDFRDTSGLMKEILYAHRLGQTNRDSAIRLLYDGLSRSRRHGFVLGEISALISLGNIYSNIGKYQAALGYYGEGVVRAAAAEKMAGQLPALYSNIGNAFRFTGRYEQALMYYYRAVVAARHDPGPTPASQLYINLASLLQLSGQQDRGFYYLDIAEKAALEEENNYILGGILINKGVYFAHKDQWETSETYFRRALDIGSGLGSYTLRYNALNNLGSLYLLQKKPEQALPYLEEAENFARYVNIYYRNGVLIALGEAYLMLGRNDEAESVLIQAKNNATQASMTGDIQEVYALLARLYVAAGRYRDAYIYRDMAAVLKDSLSGQAVAERINGLEVRYRTSEKNREILRQQLQITQQEERLRTQNSWVAVTAAGAIVLLAFLIGIYWSYRQKQRFHVNQYRLLRQEQEIGQLKAMMKGEEQERTRIAGDLHDGIGGMLASIKMHLAAVRKRYREPEPIGGLDEVMTMLQETATEVRKTSHNLMPDVLLRYHLPDALRIYCENISIHDHLKVDLQFYGNLDVLDQSLALSLYRIVQELIQNIQKHAQATQAAIRIREHERMVSIMVEDNGVGFEGDPGDGMGLQQIRSRVQVLRGYFALESKKGQGTTAYIELEIPNLASNP